MRLLKDASKEELRPKSLIIFNAIHGFERTQPKKNEKQAGQRSKNNFTIVVLQYLGLCDDVFLFYKVLPTRIWNKNVPGFKMGDLRLNKQYSELLREKWFKQKALSGQRSTVRDKS